MNYPTRKDEIGLDRLYFYSLIQNPQALPPPGLDPLTAEVIRRLVLEEQLAEVKSVYRLEPAKARVWQTIMAETSQPTTAWPPVSPVNPPAGRYAPAGRSEPGPIYGRNNQPARRKSFFEWGQLFVKAGMVATVLVISLIILVMVSHTDNNFETSMPIPIQPGAGKMVTPGKPGPLATKSPGYSSPKNETSKAIPVINMKDLIGPAEEDLAGVLQVDPAQLQVQMHSGLSLQALAKSLNTEPDLIKNTLIESFKRQLNEGLKAGKWNDSQVEQALDQTPDFVDQILNTGKY